jgi:hypothetical protein
MPRLIKKDIPKSFDLGMFFMRAIEKWAGSPVDYNGDIENLQEVKHYERKECI